MDAWRYRDYVIDSLNRDKPFDQFVREQLAGDELDPANQEYLTASIFHRLGPVRRNAGNTEIALSRNEVLTERTDIIGAALLGMTMGCARCHNHKLEPISQRDYYALQAYLAATEEHNLVLATEAERTAWEQETQRLKDQIAELKQRVREGARLARVDGQLTPEPVPEAPRQRGRVRDAPVSCPRFVHVRHDASTAAAHHQARLIAQSERARGASCRSVAAR